MAIDNCVTIVGNVTRDPELAFTTSGMALAKFGLAVNRRWQKGDEWEEKVSFFDVIAWGKLGENVAETLSKGNRVIVMGRLDQQTWEDKESGGNRSKVELIAEAVGADLKWATATIVRNEKEGGGAFGREPDFDSGRAAPAQRPAPRSAAARTAHLPAEEPFVVSAADWQPGIFGSYPERLLR